MAGEQPHAYDRCGTFWSPCTRSSTTRRRCSRSPPRSASAPMSAGRAIFAVAGRPARRRRDRAGGVRLLQLQPAHGCRAHCRRVARRRSRRRAQPRGRGASAGPTGPSSATAVDGPELAEAAALARRAAEAVNTAGPAAWPRPSPNCPGPTPRTSRSGRRRPSCASTGGRPSGRPARPRVSTPSSRSSPSPRSAPRRRQDVRKPRVETREWAAAGERLVCGGCWATTAPRRTPDVPCGPRSSAAPDELAAAPWRALGPTRHRTDSPSCWASSG